MGTYLSTPDTQIAAEDGERYWARSVRGWRVTMEDAHIALPSLAPGIALYAVFDGHGGAQTSHFAREHFAECLLQQSAFARGRYAEALRAAFLAFDARLAAEDVAGQSGCTALVALRVRDRLFVANAGDSRCLLFRDDHCVYQMNAEHKPALSGEKARIYAAGGVVVGGRVVGNLNLSRAFGDLAYKDNPALAADEQIISAAPDVVEKAIEAADRYLLLGCDGLFEVLGDAELYAEVIAVAESGREGEALDAALEQTVAMGGYAPSGRDNITALLVRL